jgi:hypothetical protein
MASTVCRTPTPKLRVELMRPVLVYRVQENVFGLRGRSRKSRIQDLASDANRRRFKTGTKIVREWKGNSPAVSERWTLKS